VTLAEGSGEYVGSLSGTISTPGGGTISAVSASSLPFSFSSTSSALQSTAGGLAAQSPAGTVGTATASGSTLNLVGTSSGINYFSLTSSLLSGITTINVNLSGGGVGVVDLGSVTNLNNKTVAVAAGTSASNVLFNTTGSLTLNNVTFDASALASGAISTDGDTLGGSLFAAGSLTVYNTTQSYTLFNGCGPGYSVPETPFLPFLPIVAIGVVGSGVAWRYHRQRTLGALRY
jgi:choice-of-anchor A domain-containing protein